jgi:hypothetical protein
LDAAHQRIEQLELEAETLNCGSLSFRSAAERIMASDEELRSQIAILKKEVSQSKALNADIASRPGRLIELYKEGKLVGSLQYLGSGFN